MTNVERGAQILGAQPFVILFQGRSGSTWLVETLDAHPQILVERDEHVAGIRDRGSAAQLRWVGGFFAQETRNVRALGFKTKLSDVLDKDAFARLLREVEAQVVLLRRRNRVKLVVSWIRAKRLYESTGNWNLYDEKQRIGPVSIEPGEFDRKLQEVEGGRRALAGFVEALGVPVLRIDYEDLLTRTSETLRGLYAFLGSDYWLADGRSVKATSDNLREAVENIEELRMRYAGTQYAAMFDEVLRPASSGKDIVG